MKISGEKLARAAWLMVAKGGWEESEHPRDANGQFSAGASAAHEKHDDLVSSGVKGAALAKAHRELARKAAAAADLVGDDNAEKARFFADKAATHEAIANGLAPKKAPKSKIQADTVAPAAAAANRGGLTAQQHDALRAYAAQTGVRSGYEDINDHLAGTLPGHLSEERRTAAAENAKHLEAAIASSPAPKDTTMYRGAPVPANAKVGDVLQTPRLLSTSASLGVAQKFAELGSRPGTHAGVLHISVTKGTPLLNVNKAGGSKIRGEKEHLLGSNQKLYITGIDRSGPVPQYHVSTSLPKG